MRRLTADTSASRTGPTGSEVIGVAVLRDVIRVAGGERVPTFALAIAGRELHAEWICYNRRFIPVER
jgi:hypothetical protein